ncbi:hypothetical protein AVEN_67735-1 [Araneus ventricosus]|uniref:Uncharacterized protein n=1 Tax=Araneus ventricosus TaxID=182803 RepID=A0A4Y2JM76_ARAVE|nr:hypothetical protein AVEN_148663-1 [Araneus ventricosus]GBN70159.1 hypothetical protein AVEN_67735-1 [Araneus ventricosus]
MYSVTQRNLVLQLIPHMLYRRQVRGAGRSWKSLNMTLEVLGDSSCVRTSITGKLPLEDHLGKVPRGVEECHQHNAGPLRFHVSQLECTGLHRLC